jgi:hypothetical protein
MWETITELFQRYMGTGLLVAWCLISIIYLWIHEKRMHLRVLFVYTPVVLLLIFFNPWIAGLFYQYVGTEIYYRILWLIPMSVLISYTLLHLYGSVRQKIRPLVAIGGVIFIMLSGNYVYDDIHFQRAQNLYHVPQSVVEICDFIEVDGREVLAAFPHELIIYVRQYSPVVCMPYGREVMLDLWGNYDPFYAAMEADIVSVKTVTRLAKESGCHYVILSIDKELDGAFEEYGFVRMKTIEGYDVYLDQNNVPTL